MNAPTNSLIIDTGKASGGESEISGGMRSNLVAQRAIEMQEIAATQACDRTYDVPTGMPLSIFEDKYSRRKDDGSFQKWDERLREVVLGNFMLDSEGHFAPEELTDTLDLALKGVIPFSGRHLQHGDSEQPGKNMELFTNCSTAAFNFSAFWLLLNGSGVGADYSCYTRRIDFAKFMPHVRFVLDDTHADYWPAANEFNGGFESKRDALHKYPSNSEQVRWFDVEDSREGWVKVVAILETAAWQEKHADKLYIFDFTQVRPAGAPIRGQQNRPASGPLPLMRVLAKLANIKGIPGMAPWKQAMHIDHYLASAVQLGGVRRSARMATKFWKDHDIFDFIEIKRGGHLWSANISVTVDAEFWEQATDPRSHAARVFQAATAAQYLDGTGEPGFINVDKLNRDMSDIDTITADNYINHSAKLQLHPRTRDMMGKILGYLKEMKYPFIVNPCGEIPLAMWGGYCTISDVCLSLAQTREEAVRAVAMASRSLIRANRMNSLYSAEVRRTNRIGVSLTGIHEFAANHFDCDWYDLVNVYNDVTPDYHNTAIGQSRAQIIEAEQRQSKAREFWEFIALLRRTCEESANEYADALGMNRPHTYTTIKPSGTIAKVMNCTEGAHLPAVAHYMRWVQFQKETTPGVKNPKVAEYELLGYPIKDISHMYTNYVVVGFPTKQPIYDILGERTVTAEDATPAEQFEWLRLLETHWFGLKEDGSSANGQVSFTLKYDPKRIDYNSYMKMMQQHMPTVRACAIMPVQDMSAYAYQPEEKISPEQYDAAVAEITARINANARKLGILSEQDDVREDYDDAMLACAGGVCAVDFSINR